MSATVRCNQPPATTVRCKQPQPNQPPSDATSHAPAREPIFMHACYILPQHANINVSHRQMQPATSHHRQMQAAAAEPATVRCNQPCHRRLASDATSHRCWLAVRSHRCWLAVRDQQPEISNSNQPSDQPPSAVCNQPPSDRQIQAGQAATVRSDGGCLPCL